MGMTMMGATMTMTTAGMGTTMMTAAMGTTATAAMGTMLTAAMGTMTTMAMGTTTVAATVRMSSLASHCLWAGLVVFHFLFFCLVFSLFLILLLYYKLV
jgi:hypothetical protein